MRLLRRHGDTFSLTEYYNNIPKYAILSHTWGDDDQEVTYKDIVGNIRTDRNTFGYGKLLFCAIQAANLGFSYFWVDTCCIDKSSSAELSEAINSMFRWYKHAAVCFVYLADISTQQFYNDNNSIRSSRWFTRGWTLQELVAPMRLEFFTSDGERIGDRHSLQSHMVQATGVSIEALEGCSLGRFTVEDRLSWAKSRVTKREEDAAYSLLGIFDVHMPLIYGEGRERAMFRLSYETQLYERRRYGVLYLFLRLNPLREKGRPGYSLEYIRRAFVILWAIAFTLFISLGLLNELAANVFAVKSSERSGEVWYTTFTFVTILYGIWLNAITKYFLLFLGIIEIVFSKYTHFSNATVTGALLAYLFVKDLLSNTEPLTLPQVG